MTDQMKPRFAAVAERMRAAESGETKASTGLGRFRRTRAEEQDVAVATSKIDVSNSPIFKILNDASLDPKEKADKIAELLFFNEEDLEANLKSIAENQAAVGQLLDDFTEHNKAMIRLARDNPLSELQTNLREVFENYHAMDEGRAELRDKLAVIDKILTEHGGPEGLVKALLNSKDKTEEKKELERQLEELRKGVEVINAAVKTKDREALALKTVIAEEEKDSFLFFKGEKKRRIVANKIKLAEIEADTSLKREDLTTATTDLTGKAAAFETFLQGSDYKVHEQILEILDIGSEEFKEKLKALADATLNYIENTTDTLKGVGKQLGVLHGRVIDVHTLTQNTAENVSILLDAQRKAQENNAIKLKEIEATDASTGIEGMKREKKLRFLNDHVSSVEKTVQTTASVSSELERTQTQLSNMKDQMKSGLNDAMEHQLMAVGSAAVTGNATIMRIEGLATDVQSLVSRGLYTRETHTFLGDFAKDMERKFMAQMAKNEGIKTMSDAVRAVTETMSEGNDIMLDIAGTRKELIDRLIKTTQDLGKANEDSLAIDGEINRRVFVKDGQLGVGAPSAPSMG